MDIIHNSNANKLPYGAHVIFIEFETLFVSIKRPGDNQHLEYVQRIDPFAAFIVFTYSPFPEVSGMAPIGSIQPVAEELVLDRVNQAL